MTEWDIDYEKDIMDPGDGEARLNFGGKI